MVNDIKNKRGIYQILNKVTNKRYIGSTTVSFYERWICHKVLLNQNKHHSKHLQSSWNKHGEDNFEFSIIEEVEKDNCIEREQYWLDYYNSANAEFGYNINPNAHSCAGRKLSDEHKRKLSELHKGKVITQEMKNHLSKINKGNKHTDETKRKIAEAGKGRKFPNRKLSDEHKRKLSIAFSGENNPNYGKKHTDEVKLNMSKSREKYKYILLNPDGIEIETTGMKRFCKENNLNSSCMFQLCSGKLSHHRCWTFVSKTPLNNEK